MKSSIAIVLAVATTALAQLSGLPQCADSCALKAIGGTGCQNPTDAKCVCTKQTFLNDVNACIKTACSPADQEQTLKFAQSFCGSAGITIPMPSATGAATAATSATEAATTTATATTMTTATTAAASSTAMASSSMAATSSAASSSKAASSSAASSSAKATPTGAAANLQVPALAGLGAILAFAL